MSIAVIGGVVASTFLTLVVVPVVYTWMDRLTVKARSRPARRDRPSGRGPARRVTAPLGWADGDARLR